MKKSLLPHEKNTKSNSVKFVCHYASIYLCRRTLQTSFTEGSIEKHGIHPKLAHTKLAEVEIDV